MDGQIPQTSQAPQVLSQPSSTISYPTQLQEAKESLASLTKLLLESGKTITVLRREFRGEALFQDEEGSSKWIQVSKPTFIKMDNLKEKPIMVFTKMPDGTEKWCYVPNDEAIDEILSMLKSMGINQITPLTNLDENTILDDLREFECKLAGVLNLKQKAWGVDKELLPMLQTKIKTMVQDARYQACKGNILRALTTNVQRVEQSIEGDRSAKRISSSPYP